MTHSVAILALSPVIGYDLAIPPQVFGVANEVLGRREYDVRTVGVTADPVTSVHGYAIVPQAGVEALAAADTVIVPGTVMPGPRREGRLPDDLAEALAGVRPGTRLVSICTGAFVLGAAGLLDGRRATTHWDKAADFRRLYPKVDLDPNVLFVDDGDVLTSAGLSAGNDLCLHIVRKDVGADVANEVARYLVVPPWREGGQAQYIDRAVPLDDAGSTAALRAWLAEHLAEKHSIASLAAHAHMSPRTFARRFREETGQTPGAWLTQQRIREAERLLEATDLPIDLVAQRAGLGTGASLRQHMRRTAGVGPASYRRTFRGPESTRHPHREAV
ncbi:GlxA family transcriptional regulator [Cumulibacter manganitolerans]|uniref:GlxA family transcriptional regulator n=1 Tax=Cumulibacter manganitolerans TaxID=1884992 RepID=UPI001294F76A|nr:helix-turn-helix domain-containing protein [Cumulibacter manganitolerans]